MPWTSLIQFFLLGLQVGLLAMGGYQSATDWICTAINAVFLVWTYRPRRTVQPPGRPADAWSASCVRSQGAATCDTDHLSVLPVSLHDGQVHV